MFIFTQSCAYKNIIYDTLILPSVTRIDPPAHFVALRIAVSSSRDIYMKGYLYIYCISQASAPAVSTDSTRMDESRRMRRNSD